MSDLHSPTLVQIGERYRHARIEADLTQQQVADAVGLSRSSISNFEGGRQDPPTSKLMELCRIVGITSAVLWDAPPPCPTCGCAWNGPTVKEAT
jgi:transcriptional regulator with XRE-family HTH domain